MVRHFSLEVAAVTTDDGEVREHGTDDRITDSVTPVSVAVNSTGSSGTSVVGGASSPSSGEASSSGSVCEVVVVVESPSLVSVPSPSSPQAAAVSARTRSTTHLDRNLDMTYPPAPRPAPRS